MTLYTIYIYEDFVLVHHRIYMCIIRQPFMLSVFPRSHLSLHHSVSLCSLAGSVHDFNSPILDVFGLVCSRIGCNDPSCGSRVASEDRRECQGLSRHRGGSSTEYTVAFPSARPTVNDLPLEFVLAHVCRCWGGCRGKIPLVARALLSLCSTILGNKRKGGTQSHMPPRTCACVALSNRTCAYANAYGYRYEYLYIRCDFIFI